MSEPAHLQRLNPEQHRAVTAIDGPVLVLAGAGSGKTRVLTRRIAHLMHSGVDPKNVIALTFTNKAANEMRERVAELIGDRAERVWCSTFHSSCARILRKDIEPLGWTRRFAIYDDDDQLRLIRGIVADAGYDPSRVVPRDVMRRIDHYKNRMLGPTEVLDQRRSHISDPIVRIWRDYEAALQASDALDFNDLVGKAVLLFQRHPEVLAKYREQFRYVLVDEYQDTNRGQYLFLRLLADEHRNLAVVGDDDQSIYGFRGADVSNILTFQEDYPEAAVVRLEQNYRSTGHILQLANAVVAHNPDRLDKKLWTESENGAKVQLIVTATVRDEAARVATALHTLRRQGHAWSDLAVIYRTNAIARYFEGALRSQRIPHKVVGGRKFYERREVRDLLCFLRLMVNPVDDAALLRVVNVPTRGVGAKTVAALRAEAQKRGQPLLSTARATAGGRSVGQRGLTAFVRLIDELSLLSRDLGLAPLVTEVIERSGLRAMLEGEVDDSGEITREARGRLENLQALITDADAFVSPPDVVAPVEQLTAWLDRIALTAGADEVPDGGRVTLMTVHSSKGLEFPVVFVVQMNEGMFPHERSIETGLEEERRLAYVAFTRAMQRLVVTRSQRTASPRGPGRAAQPSRFLFGIPTEVCNGDLPGGEAATSGRSERLASARATSGKLSAFLAHHREQPPPDATEDPDLHTLVDIETISQLRRGVRVRHPRFGVGEIRQVKASTLYIAFGARQQRVEANTPGLKVVLD